METFSFEDNIFRLNDHFSFTLFDITRIKAFKFIFLKFANKPIQEFKLFGDAALSGFEFYLTSLQCQIEGFGEKNIGDNLGIQNKKLFRLCGKEGMKDDGVTPHFLCPARKPQDYYVLIENGVIIKSAFDINELNQSRMNNIVSKIEKRHYSGCLWFFDKNSRPRKLTLDN